MNWKSWAYSLVSAGIQGAATTLGAINIAPSVFNFSSASGWAHIGELALSGAWVPVLALLKQSPLPALTTTTTATTVVTQETKVQPKE